MKSHLAPIVPSPPEAGFTLIEIIGVLAIMAILAGVLTPAVIKQIAHARADREDQTLRALGDGVMQHVRKWQTIPGASTWSANVAAVLGYSDSQVRYSDPATQVDERIYLVHPAFEPSSGADPVYVQNAAGALLVDNARILILSSSRPGLVLPVSSGKPNRSNRNITAFEDIWNWHYDPATKAPPAGWPNSWRSQGENLHVERLNLGSVFERVTFSNRHFPTNAPFARFGETPAIAFNQAAAVQAFYVEGTVLQLFRHDDPFTFVPPIPDDLELIHSVTEAANLVYENGHWELR